MTQNPVKKLSESSPDLEIWWDSSPLIYDAWAESMGGADNAGNLFDIVTASPGSTRFGSNSLVRGSTTNPPLTWQAIEGEPTKWSFWLKSQLEAEPNLTAREAMWRLFIEVAVQGADRLTPIFEASGCRNGYVCCQVDPRDMTNLDAMLEQARRIHGASPNLMVKIPGTKEGIEGVRILTSEGVPTNVTLGFTVPQLVAVGQAAQAGLAQATERGTDLRYWRSCAVMMLGRYEAAAPMQSQAEERGINLSESDLRWAGISIFRKAHRIFQERGYPSKLMAASMRLGPVVDGVTRVWHLEKLAGANAVLTIFPNVFEAFLAAYGDLPLEPQIDEPVPEEVMERLLQIPYFAEAYDEHGIAPGNWVKHPALQATAASFSEAMEEIEMFAARCIEQS
jgi:transaldolase